MPENAILFICTKYQGLKGITGEIEKNVLGIKNLRSYILKGILKCGVFDIRR